MIAVLFSSFGINSVAKVLRFHREKSIHFSNTTVIPVFGYAFNDGLSRVLVFILIDKTFVFPDSEESLH
jgi:hypothetical protein